MDSDPIKWIGMDKTWILTRLSGFKLDSNQSFLLANLILPHPSIKFFQPLHFTTFYPYTSQHSTPTVPRIQPLHFVMINPTLAPPKPHTYGC